MTDYLAEAMKTGALPEHVRRSERKSTALRRDVEKKGEVVPPLTAQEGRSGGVFHELHAPVEGRSAPGWAGGVPVGENFHFPAPAPAEERREVPDAEAVDLALQRDSRRYDGGFFLY